jgi:hypothetical protein
VNWAFVEKKDIELGLSLNLGSASGILNFQIVNLYAFTRYCLSQYFLNLIVVRLQYDLLNFWYHSQNLYIFSVVWHTGFTLL